MKTPREKAIDLIDKFYNYVNCWDDEGNANYQQAENNAKQCALIAVDEIINIRSNDSAFNNFLWSTNNEYYNVFYLKNWEQVKQEIEKL